MLIVRVEYAPSCASCGTECDLKCCKQSDTESCSPHVEVWYCNDCLNKMEEDEENYRVLE